MRGQVIVKELLTHEEINRIKQLRLLNIHNMSHYLGVTEKTIRCWITRGILPCKRRGKLYVIPAATFLETTIPSLGVINGQ